MRYVVDHEILSCCDKRLMEVRGEVCKQLFCFLLFSLCAHHSLPVHVTFTIIVYTARFNEFIHKTSYHTTIRFFPMSTFKFLHKISLNHHNTYGFKVLTNHKYTLFGRIHFNYSKIQNDEAMCCYI